MSTHAAPVATSPFFEDLVVGAVHTTTGRTITEADIVLHAGHTGDFFPHHMDAEFAKSTPFGERIAHGTLTFSIAVGLKALHINPHTMTYGFDRLRFPKPLLIGDTITVRVTVASVEPYLKRPGLGRFTEAIEVVNQRGEVVMVFDHIGLIERRPARSAEGGAA